MDALDFLAQDNYIIVNKTLIKEIGLENAVVLGTMCGYQRGFGNEFFYREQEKIIEDTGLTEYSIRKSIKELKDLGYLIVKKIGMPAKVYYKVNLLKFEFLSSRSIVFDTSRDSENNTANKNNMNKNNINNNTSNKKEIEKEKIKKIYNYFLDKAIYYKYAKTKKNDYDDIPEKQIKAIKKTLDNVDNMDIIIQTIDRYFEVITNKNYFFDTFWNVEKFFGQKNAFDDFLEEGSKWINYKLFKEKQKSYNPYKKGEISRETAYPEFDDVGYIR